MGRVVMSRRQEHDAKALMDKHLHKMPGSESLYDYNKEWSDARIAEEIGYKSSTSTQAIGKLRLELFGKLGNVSTGAGNNARRIDDVEAQLKALQANYAMILNELTGMRERFAKLCQTLAINKVADVRHLAREQSQPNGSATHS